MEEKDMGIIKHSSHDHPLVLRESLVGCSNYDGGSVPVYCYGCGDPIYSAASSSYSSSSSPSSGVRGEEGTFYACPISNCSFLLHKRCAKLPPKIEHPSHPDHDLTLHPFPLYGHQCAVCNSGIDGFLYRCSDCEFDVHVCCASMALHIQDKVDENGKIHKHPLIPLEKEAEFSCDVCGKKHKGKSYLCATCGFWADQICASTPTAVDLHSHPHPLTLFRSFCYDDQKCIICNEEVKRASWVYRCSEGCRDSIHVGCLPLEEAENTENSNKDPKEDTNLTTWPLSGEFPEIITQLIKNHSLEERHKRAIKILHCRKDHLLIFVNKKIDELKDDQVCDGCGQTISSQFYYCAKCNFSLHEWCAELPNELKHVFHPEHPLHLRCVSLRTVLPLQPHNPEHPLHFLTQQDDMHLLDCSCNHCFMPMNGFVFDCFTCHFHLDLKCALLPRLIKHQVHDHKLALRRVTNVGSCNACGVTKLSTFFQCKACNFRLCIKCALLPCSVWHRYDKHPFILIYSPIKDQPDEYYCEICEEDIHSKHWFYHCRKCDQSLHPECTYSIEQYAIRGPRFIISLPPYATHQSNYS